MGHRGWIVFFHDGRYYRIYNHWRSYFSGLGVELVSEIINAKDLSDLLDTWRRLLTLGCPKDEKLCPPKEEDSGESSAEWKSLISKLPPDSKITNWFVNDLELYDDNDKMLTFGDGISIRNIYVLDLDNDEFIAVDVFGDCVCYGYPFEVLRRCDRAAVWLKFIEKNKAASYGHGFRLPKSVERPLIDCIKSKGFAIDKRVSWSAQAYVFSAQKESDTNTEEVYVKAFIIPAPGDNLHSTYQRSIPFAQVLSENPHPNIVDILDVIESREFPILVLAPYDGTIDQLDLKALDGKRDYVTAIVQAAKGVVHMHQLGAVHGDVKPKNVLYRKTDHGIEAALCDFESVCVPRIARDKEEYQNRAEGGKDLDWSDITWGPYKSAHERKKRKKMYMYSLWEEDWDRHKYSFEVDYENGWKVDASCLGFMLGYVLEAIGNEDDCAESEEDNRSGTSRVKESLEEMKAMLESTHDFHTAITNLENLEELANRIEW